MEHGETSSKEPYEINAETEECENVSIAAGDVETGLHSTRIGVHHNGSKNILFVYVILIEYAFLFWGFADDSSSKYSDLMPF
ncbi:hypothetical protein L2E82_25621 [Cichorium intybus]|uniref:Uncharacterized protein n=1 Tax=Cichorium intybus TaxID=13427 RepID=A0ACB9E4F4_CICIN|nr:hypothetical protein L2E82_25621 [Cichorium intybus]